MATVIVGLFEHAGEEIDRLVRCLESMGIPRSQVSIVAREHAGSPEELIDRGGGGVAGTHARDTYEPAGVGVGAAGGAVVGAALFAALGLLMVPGAGLLAIGPLSGLLTGAGLGAAAGGVAGALIGSGIPKAAAEEYAAGVAHGMTLVTVHQVDDKLAEKVTEQMSCYGAVTVEEHMEEGPESGPEGVRPAGV